MGKARACYGHYRYRSFLGIRPDIRGQAIHNSICWLRLTVTIVATGTLISGLSDRLEMRAFLASNFILVGLLTTGGAAMFPVMLYSTVAPQNSLTAYSVASGDNSLRSVKRDTQGYY